MPDPHPIKMMVSSEGRGEYTVEITYKTDSLKGEGMIMLVVAEDISYSEAVKAMLEQAEQKNEEPMYVFSGGVPFIYPVHASEALMGIDAVNILVMPTRKKEEQREAPKLHVVGGE